MGATITLTGNVTAVQAITKNQSLATVAGLNSTAPSPATPYVVDWSVITNKPTFGTSASRDVSAAGDAMPSQVVLGADSRLTGTRATTVAQITDALTTGRNVLLAPSQGAARLALGVSVYGDTLVTSPDAPTTRATLGLGSMAVQQANAVAVTGGSASGLAISGGTANSVAISGGTVTSLTAPMAVSDGGTGANNAAQAKTNLGAGATGVSLFGSVLVSDAQSILNVVPSPVFHCRLDFVSTSILRLTRRQGSYIFINGVFRQIPQAGVDLAPTGTTVNVTYNIYAFWTGTAIQLEAAAVARATDPTFGHQIKSGDPTRTLVGKAYTQVGPTWDSSNPLLTISYHNRLRRAYTQVLSTTTGSLTYSVATFTPGTSAFSLSWGEDVTEVDTDTTMLVANIGLVVFNFASIRNSATAVLVNSSSGNYLQAPPGGTGNYYGTPHAKVSTVLPDHLGINTSGLAFSENCILTYQNGGGSYQIIGSSATLVTISG